jgi:hypothetical protein
LSAISNLVTARQFLERERHDPDFRRQRKGVAAEIGKLDGVRPARHQNEPRIIRCINCQEPRQSEIADKHGVGGKLRVQRPDRVWHVASLFVFLFLPREAGKGA